MDKDNPLVSVCIPVYNRIYLIQETIHSVLVQDYPNVEIVIQDNASTDGTWELLKEMAEKHSQISLERNEVNYGPIPNWNLAMRRANGEYAMWLSSDDLLEPGFIRECIETFRRNDTDAVTTNFHFLCGEKKTVREKKKIKQGLFQNFDYELLCSPMFFTINFTLFSRKTIESMMVNGRLMRKNLMACDYDLWFRLAFAGKKVYYLEKPLGTYRIHESNDSKNKKKLIKHTILVLMKHRKNLKRVHNFAYHIFMLRHMIRLLRPHYYDKRLFQLLKREVFGR